MDDNNSFRLLLLVLIFFTILTFLNVEEAFSERSDKDINVKIKITSAITFFELKDLDNDYGEMSFDRDILNPIKSLLS